MDLLAKCEADIEQYEASYINASKALLLIHESELWVDDYYSFENYCEKRWGFKASHRKRLVNAGRLLVQLEDSPEEDLPPTERCTRPLMKIKAWHKDSNGGITFDEQGTQEKRAKAWERVLKKADGKTITEELVSTVVHQHFYKPYTKPQTEEALDNRTRKGIWDHIEEIAKAPLTPHQLIGKAAYSDSGPYTKKALRYLIKLSEILDRGGRQPGEDG